MKQTNRSRSLLVLITAMVVVILLNVINTQYFQRFDFTADKRYTMSDATKTMLNGLKDPVLVEVYLEGDFPAGFDRLRNAIKETLDEFNAYSGGKVNYRFTDPSAATDAKKRSDFHQQLAEKGLQPTNLYVNEDGKKTEKIIFPGAIIRYGDKEQAVLMLKGNKSASAEVQLNQSIEGVEFELATGIKKVTSSLRKRIGVIQGHRELNGTELYDLGITLKEQYAVEKVELQKVVSLDGFDMVIVARPDSTFSEPDKFKLDQFIVKGGNAVFFLDGIRAQLDSIKPEGSLHLPADVNLTDLLFKYGVRVNGDIVMDINSSAVRLMVGIVGDKPDFKLVPWRYFPVINTFGNHPITKNMDGLLMRFTSTLDTVAAPGIRKTPLLFTSEYSRIIPAPVRLSFNDARLEPKPEQYQVKNLPLAWLLEGSFQSLYTNRLAKQTVDTFKFVERGKPGKVLVVSDGDFPANDINYQQRSTYPLGYDKHTAFTFANKDFILNAVSYMLDENGLILARAKNIQLRPLDKVRLKKEKTKWQVFNLALPPVTIALFGMVWAWQRRRKYGNKRNA